MLIPICRRLAWCVIVSAIAVTFASLDTSASAQDTGAVANDPVPLESNRTAGEARILAALEEPTSVELVQVALSDAARVLSVKHKISIQLDDRALESVGIGSDTPISFRVQGVRLGSALNLILKELELTYALHNEVLLITTVERWESLLETRVYKVPDLLRSPYGEGLDPDMLIEPLTAMIAPWSWDRVGGNGSVRVFGDSLVISQPGSVHREIQTLLAELRRAKSLLEQDPLLACEARWDLSPFALTPARRKIEAALDAPLPKLTLIETSLSDAVIMLGKVAGIPIVLDDRALEGVGIGSDTPMTAEIEGVSLRSALKLLLDELELTFVARDDVLLITTVEEAESHLSAAAFVVRDLIDAPYGGVRDAQDLIRVITSTVAADCWEDVGGAGSIRYYDALDALVISQTDEVLDQVDSLLANLRQQRRAEGPWTVEQWRRDRARFLKATHLVIMTIERDPLSANPRVDSDVAIGLLKRSLAFDVAERAIVKADEESLTLLLTPPETVRVETLFREADLPISRRVRHIEPPALLDVPAGFF